MTMINDFDLCEQRSQLSIETLRTVKPDFIQVDELINGKLSPLALILINVSEIIRFDNNYKYIHDDPLKEYLNRPLNKFEIYMQDDAVYHHYILEGL